MIPEAIYQKRCRLGKFYIDKTKGGAVEDKTRLCTYAAIMAGKLAIYDGYDGAEPKGGKDG